LAGFFVDFLAGIALPLCCGCLQQNLYYSIAWGSSGRAIVLPRERKGHAVENLDQPAPLCFVLMPFVRKMDAGGANDQFRFHLPDDHRAG